MDEAIRHLGRVAVISEGGPLEVMYDTAHPGSRTALGVCKLVQDRPHTMVPLSLLQRASGCSPTTVRNVLERLSACGAPISLHRMPRGQAVRYEP